ncbi:MAG: hypothetical protein N3I35_05030 [Clostridia bacterium]|nr:hypothetical protein [Clostridia bacterium]
MINHILKASLDRNLTISIVYQKGSELTQRDIKVIGIDEKSIKAFCFLRNQLRVFSKENILSASLKIRNIERVAK